jgi:sulfoxide reductase heme-binding subunit YedZ
VSRAPVLAGHEWWLASRAAGIVALLLVAVSVGIGLANAARLVPPRARRTLVAVHEQTALAALLSIAAHGLLLLPDRWLHPGAAGITIPLAIGYRPLATATGIVGGYLAALLGLSFYLRRRLGPRRWRRAHTATIAVYALALLHALTAGTDAATPWLRMFLAVTGAPIVILLAARVLRRSPWPGSDPRRSSRQRAPASR